MKSRTLFLWMVTLVEVTLVPCCLSSNTEWQIRHRKLIELPQSRLYASFGLRMPWAYPTRSADHRHVTRQSWRLAFNLEHCHGLECLPFISEHCQERSNAASTRGFVMGAKPQRKIRPRAWPCYVCCFSFTAYAIILSSLIICFGFLSKFLNRISSTSDSNCLASDMRYSPVSVK